MCSYNWSKDMSTDIWKVIISKCDRGTTNILYRVSKIIKEIIKKCPMLNICNYNALNGYFNNLKWCKEMCYCFTTQTCDDAIRGGNLEIVQWLLLHNYPLSKSSCDIAAIKGHLDILRFLYTNGFRRNKLTYYLAASRGHLKVLQWLHEIDFQFIESVCNMDDDDFIFLDSFRKEHWVMVKLLNNGHTLDKIVLAAAAASKGHVNVLQWLYENGFSCDEITFDVAVCCGKLSVLKWLHDNGYPGNKYGCESAIRSYQFEALYWLYINGYPWKASMIERATVDDPDSVVRLEWLLSKGQRGLDMVQYLCELSEDMLQLNDHLLWTWGVSMMTRAVEKGCPKVVKWLHQNGFAWNESTIAEASKYNQWNVVQLLLENGCPWNKSIMEEAAGGEVTCGALKVLQLLHQQGCPWNAKVMVRAAEAGPGNLEMIKWLHQNGCPWDAKTMTIAVDECSDLEMIKWLHQNGCPWEAETMTLAVNKYTAYFRGFRIRQAKGLWTTVPIPPYVNKYLEIVKWIYQNGCPFDTSIMTTIAECGDLEMIKWMHQNGCPLDVSTMTAAAAGGYMQMVYWLHLNGCDCGETTITAAAANGYLKMALWLKNGCPWTTTATTIAYELEDYLMLKFLYENGCPCTQPVRKYIQLKYLMAGWQIVRRKHRRGKRRCRRGQNAK